MEDYRCTLLVIIMAQAGKNLGCGMAMYLIQCVAFYPNQCSMASPDSA